MSARAARARRILASSCALPALVACVFLIVVAGNQGASVGRPFDPTVLIVAGSDFEPAPLLPDGAYVFRGTGFDGQFFFYLAQDPFARSAETRTRLDNTRYRARRVLLPALAWVGSAGGNKEILPWTIPIINILAVVAATFALARWLRRRERSPWLALGFPLAFGSISGVVSDVADPLAAGLLVLGLLAWSENRTTAALLALTAVGLARETYLLPALLIVAIELYRFRAKALAWLLVPLVAAAWFAYVSTIPTAGRLELTPETPTAVPIAGAVRKILLLDNRDVPGAATWELLSIVTLLAMSLYVIWHGAAGGWRAVRSRSWPSRAELLPAAGALAVILVPFLTLPLWGNPLSYSRYGAAASAVVIMCLAMRMRFAGVLVVMTIALGVLNPYASVVPTTFGPVVTGPGIEPIREP